MYDPDAPTGSGFWHWIVVDIPGTTTELAAGAGGTPSTLPTGAKPVVGTDYLNTGLAGAGGYGGVCPPFGIHKYKLTIYALSVDSFYTAAGIMPTFTGAVHGFALNHGLKEAGKVLGKAELTLTWKCVAKIKVLSCRVCRLPCRPCQHFLYFHRPLAPFAGPAGLANILGLIFYCKKSAAPLPRLPRICRTCLFVSF